MAEQVRNYVGGQWLGAQSGETFEPLTPATGALVANAARSGAASKRAATEIGRSWSFRMMPPVRSFASGADRKSQAGPPRSLRSATGGNLAPFRLIFFNVQIDCALGT